MERLPVIHELFDTSHTLAAPLFSGAAYPFSPLHGLHSFLVAMIADGPPDGFRMHSAGVMVSLTATVHPGAVILGPTVIGSGTEVRPGAYLRGDVLVGDGCVVGNSTELKNCILFDGVQVPHYNYVGDSVLGYRAHLGAGAIASNLRADRAEVCLRDGGRRVPTGRKKLGAMVGDFAEIGCQSVLCPGAVIGRRAQIYPLTLVRGTVGADCIVKRDTTIVRRENLK